MLLQARRVFNLCRIVHHATTRLFQKPQVLNSFRQKPKLRLILQSFPIFAAAQYLSETPQQNLDNVIQLADKLYEENSYRKLRDLLIEFKAEQNAEILWRLARAEYEMAKVAPSKAEQKRLHLEAYDYVQRALDLDENNFAVHKWMFILLDKKASYEGIKERISKSYIVKEHIERACKLNPKDPTSFHLLGYYCFSVAELPWYQRKIASTLFATPPTSSYEEALEKFLMAEEIEPNFYSTNLLMIGKTYLRLNNKDRAVEYLRRAADYSVRTSEDAEVKEEATQLLKSL